ncbi:MAG TPA: hypothetical protein VG102_02485 [Candidatus Paceibacterota bacterium]|jgi:hypothetical protein|nr:hypothetical protein [Candidatus Paceibacterota bacterium]
MDPEEKEFNVKLQERFDQLPKVIQDAITSADVEQRMRALADTQKLHLDQWESLEKEVQLALLGFLPVEDLQKNIKSELGVSDEVAKTLAEEVSKIVFEPIRGELERQLEHPEAKAEQLTGVETARKETLGAESASSAAASALPAPVAAPATPPPPPNDEKAARAPVSEVYKPGQTSTERKEVHEDPYREPPA